MYRPSSEALKALYTQTLPKVLKGPERKHPRRRTKRRDIQSRALGTGLRALSPEISAMHHRLPPAHPTPHPSSEEPGLTGASQQPDPAVPGPCPAWPSGPHSPSEAAHTGSAGQRGRCGQGKGRGAPQIQVDARGREGHYSHTRS